MGQNQIAMIKLTDLLLELDFNVATAKKYPWKRDSSGLKYTFNTAETEDESGMEYEVDFYPHKDDETDENTGTFERKYNPKGKGYELTGEGNALKINATVMDITLDFMNRNKEWYDIVISPVNSKRFSIVKRFLDENIPKDKFKMEYEEGIIRISRKVY